MHQYLVIISLLKLNRNDLVDVLPLILTVIEFQSLVILFLLLGYRRVQVKVQMM